MRRFLTTLALVLVWTAIVFGVVLAEAAWFGQPAVVRGDVRSIETHLVAKLSDATEDRRIGSAALVLIHRWKIVSEHGFGIARVETRAEVKPDLTRYQVASVSKAVTAWGVMKLVQDGRLGLDAPVYRDKVTVRQLLSHTAGVDEDLNVVREPGTVMSYSGGGYTVLQELIEKTTGRPFPDYMEETVFQPLGMSGASFDWEELVSRPEDLATPYDHAVVPVPRRRPVALASAGLYATPRDLAQFVLAFKGNPVLSNETLQKMMLAQPATSGTWGLGLTLFAPDVVGHDGGTAPAWGAMVRVNPSTGDGMVLTVSGGEGAVNRLGHDWVYWETGKMTTAGRRQIVYGRVVPASLAIVLGAIVIAVLRLKVTAAR